MNFKLPIGTATYTIRLVENLSHGDRKAYGLTQFNEKLISLDTKQQPLPGLHTLFHEFFHAALHEHGVNVLEPDEEELVVDALAHALCISLQRSKKFRELIMGVVQ